MKQLNLSILRCLIYVCFASQASAQPLGVRHYSIEARIAEADVAVLATFADLTHKVLVERGRWEPNGKDEYTISLNVQEVFKGEPGKRITDLEPVTTGGYDERYKQWHAAKTTFLCFLYAAPDADKKRKWIYFPLGEPVKGQELFGQKSGVAPMFSQDFSVLKTEEEIFARAREYGKISENEKLPNAATNMSVKVPHLISAGIPGAEKIQFADFNDIIVPVNQSLETLAHRLIKSPQNFFPENNPYPNDWPHWNSSLSFAKYKLKISGIRCLRPFRSDANIELLKELLVQPRDKDLRTDSISQRLRVYALELLLIWGVQIDRPAFWEEVIVLDLSNSQTTEVSLAMVGQFKNLKTLNLLGCVVSRNGLLNLRGLDRILTIEIANDQLDDTNVRTLNEIDLLHRLSIATADRSTKQPQTPAEATAIHRPRTRADVISLSFWNSPITNASLRELKEFTNVTWIDLRGTRINDLSEIAHMKKMKKIILNGTQIDVSGLSIFSNFKHLEAACLEDLPITDAELKVFHSLDSLMHLRLDGTQVTAAGIQDLKNALPNCKIYSAFEE